MASEEKTLFTFMDTPVTYTQNLFYGSGILIVVLTIVAVIATELTPLDALIAGVAAMLLHWVSALTHYLGHVYAAKRTGYPMRKVRLWWVLGLGRFPKNEPNLSPDVHIQRALGGPIANIILMVIVGVLAIAFWNVGGMLQFLLGWMLFENIVFGIGALLTPYYTESFAIDGGTILHYWRIKQAQKRDNP